jgi:hypothetical protein
MLSKFEYDKTLNPMWKPGPFKYVCVYDVCLSKLQLRTTDRLQTSQCNYILHTSRIELRLCMCMYAATIAYVAIDMPC